MQLSFNVQWQFWADEWINVGFFDNRDAANAYLDTMIAAWPFHQFQGGLAPANLDGRNEVVRLSMLLVADLLSEDRMAKTRAERTMMALDSAIRWVSKFGRPVREL
jgi:hypothetical protein